MNLVHEDKLQASWHERQMFAEKMQPLLGQLHRENALNITLYGRTLIGASCIDIIKAHRAVRRYTGEKLKLRETYPILQSIASRTWSPCEVDIGKLAVLFRAQSESLEDFLSSQLPLESSPQVRSSQDVVLYGFGRIGRLLARLLIERQSPSNPIRLRAIVVRGGQDGDLAKRASLLRRDSVHGPFDGSITTDDENQAILANGAFIQVIYANSPSDINYQQYGIDNAIVIDNTGIWRDEKGLSQHIHAKGVAKVLLTAPGKGDLKNIVYGVNHDDIKNSDIIVSAASCTTNAITPILKVLDEKFGIEQGHVETVHSFTNDQNLIDNFHKGERRGRSAALNMVITETGAAKAVAKAYPALAGKLTGNAIRVPTPNVSLAILNLHLDQATEKTEVNAFLRDVALFSDYQHQIDYSSSTEIVSTDLVGSRFACVVDSQATIVSGNRVCLYCWYDNEFVYSCQVERVLNKMAGTETRSYP